MQVLVISTPSASNASDVAAFQRHHPVLLLQSCRRAEIGAARVGDRGDADPPIRRRQGGEPLQERHPGFAEGLRVRHDVRLPHRDKSRAPRYRPTRTWCSTAHWRAAPMSPRRIASASSPSRMNGPSAPCPPLSLREAQRRGNLPGVAHGQQSLPRSPRPRPEGRRASRDDSEPYDSEPQAPTTEYRSKFPYPPIPEFHKHRPNRERKHNENQSKGFSRSGGH